MTLVNAVFEVVVCPEKRVKKHLFLATQRAQITVLWQEGYSERMIVSKLHCSTTAVHSAKVSFLSSMKITKTEKEGGGHEKVSPGMIT